MKLYQLLETIFPFDELDVWDYNNQSTPSIYKGKRINFTSTNGKCSSVKRLKVKYVSHTNDFISIGVGVKKKKEKRRNPLKKVIGKFFLMLGNKILKTIE